MRKMAVLRAHPCQQVFLGLSEFAAGWLRQRIFVLETGLFDFSYIEWDFSIGGPLFGDSRVVSPLVV